MSCSLTKIKKMEKLKNKKTEKYNTAQENEKKDKDSK